MLLDLLRELTLWILKIASNIQILESRYAIRERIFGNWEMRGILWMHGASLGECQVLLELARRLPQETICMTTQKRAVRDWLVSRIPSNTQVCIAPLDHPEVLVRLFTRGKPKALILCENELWPGWIRACRKLRVPVALVSGRISERGVKRWKFWAASEFRLMMPGIDPIWVQSAEDAQRFVRAGVKSVRLSGDWKWLAVPDSLFEQRVASIQEWESRPVDLALISVHREEWPKLGIGLQKLIEFEGACVLVPRYPEEHKWFEARLRALQIPVVNWPQIKRGSVSMIQQLGLVQQVLTQSRLALMGGSFCTVTSHNYREPLMQGVPVLVGPYGGHNESELSALQTEKVVKRIANLEDLCIGRKGRDCWLSGWFPWEERLKIPAVLLKRKANAETAYTEFQQWLEVIR
jgi:3-deoxy-D-manno-octulosonic-acid transferase